MNSRPNILVLMTDQQSSTMMSAAGNAHLRTPAMDSIAAAGVRFDRAYCTNPVCAPSRYSMLTGLMPGVLGVNNDDARPEEALSQALLDGALGSALRKGGYRALYGGKQGLPGTRVEDLGFEVFSTAERGDLARDAAVILHNHRSGDAPLLMFLSFINPHDICYMAIRDHVEGPDYGLHIRPGIEPLRFLDQALELPAGIDEETFFKEYCPPLPGNHEPQQEEPEAIMELRRRRPFRVNAYRAWDDRKWRLHRWAYARLTEVADAEIGVVLRALRCSGHEDRTVVVHTSDHGDHDGSHKLEHKTALYEEACRIPFTVAVPGGRKGWVDREHLVSSGVDLLPTLCDFAGVDAPPHSTGRSLRPAIDGRGQLVDRSFVRVESAIGRAVITHRHKFVVYDGGRHHEQLYDLLRDPGETRNWAGDPDYSAVLEELRRLL